MSPIGLKQFALAAVALVICHTPASSQSYQLNGATVSKTEYDAAMIFNESRQLLNEQKWDQANEKLKKALELNPKLKQARNNLGIVLMHQGKYHEAITLLRALVDEDPSQAMAWATLGGANQSVGNIEDAIDAYKHFLTLKADYSEAPRYKDLIRGLEAESAKRKRVGTTQDASTYLAATAADTPKWIALSPLKVYIPTTSTAHGYRQQFQDILVKAFKKWESATDGKVHFDFVNNKADADIDCEWTDDVNDAVFKAEGGHAHIEARGGKIQHVKILLLTTSIKTVFLSDAIIGKVALHEIGHALGILGHSDNRSDIMFYSIDVSDLDGHVSPRDAKTLCERYK